MRYIGLMSGTSLDSVDAVVVEYDGRHLHLIASHCEPFPAELRHRTLALMHPGDDEIEHLGRLDLALAELFARAANNLIDESGLERASIRAIGSHGQTVRHRPEAGFTLQIGDPNLIAEHTGLAVVADFRRRDMAAGGQGAPLVPAYHQALFHSQDADRVIANIGGMANITLLPAAASRPIIGYDTGPGNVLLDGWIRQRQGLDYDRDGGWAASGQVLPALLECLLALPYFAARPPKSTGREQFNPDWLAGCIRKAGSESASPEDIQATLLELTALTLSREIDSQLSDTGEIYLCGGGSHNKCLLQRLRALLKPYDVSTTAELGQDPDWVEACAFAWLAARTLDGLSGNLSAVTGARGERILGAIYQP